MAKSVPLPIFINKVLLKHSVFIETLDIPYHPSTLGVP